ncbi:hypothetical protein HMPREF1400_00757, partial [Helicobacter pylori GAM119Bi]
KKKKKNDKITNHPLFYKKRVQFKDLRTAHARDYPYCGGF